MEHGGETAIAGAHHGSLNIIVVDVATDKRSMPEAYNQTSRYQERQVVVPGQGRKQQPASSSYFCWGVWNDEEQNKRVYSSIRLSSCT